MHSLEDRAFFLEHDSLSVKNVVAPDFIAEAVAFPEAVRFKGETGGTNY